MHKLGISIYPEHSTPEKDEAYMELAAKYGFSRIFTCLLSVEKPKEEMIEAFGGLIAKAHKLGFEVAADTNPEVFAHLGAVPENIEVFSGMGLDIIRLDGHFGDVGDRLITRNPYGIKIEFNASLDGAMELLIRHGADSRNMQMCHNFYPQRYSGLSQSVFLGLTRKWKELGLPTGAFVSSNEKDTFGPWPVYAGLPTMEIHRGLPVGLQLRHMLSMEIIDDILIGNAYASEDELKAMAETDFTKTTITICQEPGMTEEERHALTGRHHTGRADASEYFIRSCQMRADFRHRCIPQRPCGQTAFCRGDVVVMNDSLARYRGEVEIILKDVPNDGERNLVGRIPREEFIILEQMEQRPDHFWDFILS